jgi:hypothetical protein
MPMTATSATAPLTPATTGITYTPADVDALPLKRHDFHGEWNYTLSPHDTP